MTSDSSMMNQRHFIVEGSTREITEQQAAALIAAQVIFRCNSSHASRLALLEDDAVYHFMEGKNWSDLRDESE